MKRALSSKICLYLFAAGIAAPAWLALAASTQPGRPEAVARTPVASADPVERGRYLVTVAGCNDCHTPWKMGPAGPEPDMSRMLSGHPDQMEMPAPPKLPDGPWVVSVAATNTAWSGPWGVSYTANLTPDRETGLGKWTLRDFTATIRTGRHMGRGREVLPPMPIRMYKHFTGQDLAAIYSYLQTIPVIRNRVPEPLPPADARAERSAEDQGAREGRASR